MADTNEKKTTTNEAAKVNAETIADSGKSTNETAVKEEKAAVNKASSKTTAKKTTAKKSSAKKTTSKAATSKQAASSGTVAKKSTSNSTAKKSATVSKEAPDKSTSKTTAAKTAAKATGKKAATKTAATKAATAKDSTAKIETTKASESKNTVVEAISTTESAAETAMPSETSSDTNVNADTVAAAANNSVFANYTPKEEKKLFNFSTKKEEKNAAIDAIEKKVSEMEDSDTKILAELLLELKKDQEAESNYAKRHMIFSIITAVLSLSLVIICMGVLLPKITGLVNNLNVVLDNTNKIVIEADSILDNAEEIVSRADSLFDDTELVINNLQKTTDELAATDFEGIMKDVSVLVESTQGTLDEALDKLTSIDIDTLNSSIKGLNDVIEPLSNLFGGGKSTSSGSTKKGLFNW